MNKKHSLWYLYILRCKDRSFYTGITKNLEYRLKMHLTGKGSKYVWSRRPAKVVYFEKHKNRHNAAIREIAIKKLSRLEKRRLINL